MTYTWLICEKQNGIGYVTINRPDALNALNDALAGELLACFQELNADPAIGCVVLTGGGRAFMAGDDIAEMAVRPAKIGSHEYVERQHLNAFIENMPKPVIAAVNGFALGGGCELCLACDIRVASTAAKFGQLELNVGIIPLMGGSQRLPRIVGKGMAKYLLMTGEIIDAGEALRIGLVEKVTAPEELLTTCEAIAAAIMAKSPATVGMVKTLVNLSANTGLEAGLVMEGCMAADAFARKDRQEGMQAFLEKRPAIFQNE